MYACAYGSLRKDVGFKNGKVSRYVRPMLAAGECGEVQSD